MSNRGEKLLELFNEEGWDYIKQFVGDFETFFKVLSKYGMQNEISISEIPDELQNKFIYLLLQENPNEVLNSIINDFLSDVEKKGEDYYLRLRDREEVSEFFSDSGYNTSTRDIVKSMMGDDDFWEPYYNTTDDVYSDVIEELNEENLKYFKQTVLEKLKNVKIELDGTSSEELELIASEQGHDDHLFVTSDNIDRIVGDSDSLNYLFYDYLSDLRNDLDNVHSNAYNSAYSDETWQKMKNELSTYFEPNFHSKSIKIGEKTKWVEYLKINDILSIIKDFYYHYKDSQYDMDKIEYHGYFTGILTKMMDELDEYDYLDFSVGDYPDHRMVTKNINEIIKDYI
jgi:hypothetical protein